ncbi:trypsin-like serine protease [Aliishimia ponticola]|uniref:Trypsin-like serine protease n=1 Tax=Aliishimia ponticola TaxID=2499833 RepID=A0A4S4NDP6_9RHOB|nr:trypsin-like serine protease [Aliishimia ponticola]THH36188.1 trypsin-like serine protease [Aliishimia ponticola]
MRWLLLILWLIPGLASAETSKLRSLDRDYQAQGWEAVGRLDMQNGGFCSGTLIAPDLVLSAAHCVYDRANQLRKPEQMTFNAGLRNGTAAATRPVAKIAAHPDYDPNATMTLQNVRHDLALLQLAEPIPTHEIDPFVLHGEAVRNGQVSVVSYGRGREDIQSRQNACNLLDRHQNVLMFDCDVTFGSSGAPVFSHLNGRGRILSVISGGGRWNGGQVALGPHLPPLVDRLKRDLRSQQRGPAARIKRIGIGGQRASGAKFVKVN